MGKKKTKIEDEILRAYSLRCEFIDDDPDAEEDELRYKTIVEYCRQHDTVFHDGDFPHIRKSFMTLKRELKEYWKLGFKELNKRTFPNKIWKRILSLDDYHYKDVYFDPSKVLIAGVYQYGLGNCGLVAALAAVTYRITILEAIFAKPMNPEYGVYQVRLCVDGVWRTVTADDWVPEVNDKKLVIGSSLIHWAPLVEKAIAKVRGSYGALIGYCTQDALAILTGSPILRLNLSREDCWDLLQEATHHGYPMTCGTHNKDMGNEGIMPRHAYTLVQTIEIEGHKLVCIRNPSGIKKYQGKWSTSWCLEHQHESNVARAILELKDGDIEWIDWTDFVRIFDEAYICRYRPSWSVIRAQMVLEGPYDNTQKMIRISVPRNCKICVSALMKGGSGYVLYTWLTIYHVNQEDPNSIGEIAISEMILLYSKDIPLIAGDYIINFSNPLRSWKFERNIAIHSSVPVSAKMIDWHPSITTSIYQKIVEERGKEIMSSSERNDISIKKFLLTEPTRIVMIMATNYNYTQNLHIHIQCTKIAKWEMSRKKDIDEARYADVISPRSRQILIVAKCYNRDNQEDFPIKIDYWFSDEKLTKIGRSDRAAHIPSIGPWEYVHHTTAID